MNNYADFLIVLVSCTGIALGVGERIGQINAPPTECKPVVRYIRWEGQATPAQLRKYAAELRTMAAGRERMERVQ